MDIRVSGAYSAYKIYEQSGTNKALKTTAGKSVDGKDNYVISQQAEDYQKVRKALAATPDVRLERVQVVREKVEAGTYSVPPADIAARMLRIADENE